MTSRQRSRKSITLQSPWLEKVFRLGQTLRPFERRQAGGVKDFVRISVADAALFGVTAEGHNCDVVVLRPTVGVPVTPINEKPRDGVKSHLNDNESTFAAEIAVSAELLLWFL